MASGKIQMRVGVLAVKIARRSQFRPDRRNNVGAGCRDLMQ
jgi:hypothetical protein